jgi:hypothetical protein
MSLPATTSQDSWAYLERYVEPAEPSSQPNEVIIDAAPKNKADVLAAQVNERAVNWSRRLNAQVMKLPSPGGIAALTVILLVLVMVLIPVGGVNETRLQLMFDVLRGERGLPLPVTANPGTTGSSPGIVTGPPILPVLDGSQANVPGNATPPAVPANINFPLGNFGDIPPV